MDSVVAIMSSSTDEQEKGRNCAKIIGKLIVAMVLIIPVVYAALGLSPTTRISSLTFLLGSAVLVCGYYHLVYVLPGMAKDLDTRVSMEALKVSFWLVILGVAIIFLGLLNMMGILPPSAWHT